MAIDVKWSSQLEKLADELLICWQEAITNAADPWRKVCVVVNDSATENWLKQYYLLDRKIPQVMMNLEFVKLPEFINDWLAAELHGIPPRKRKASGHPYSPGVLTWRIYRILSESAADEELKELPDYIGEDRKHLRCLALSQKLAVLYDDYLNSRGQMLRNWEKGMLTSEEKVPRWQIRLYQRLVSEDQKSYAADYEEIFRSKTDAARALDFGFPRYLAVHVFDIPFMPETTLHLLEKISEALPMTFWHFNPHGEWLGESDSKKEIIRKIRDKFQHQRELLHAGESPSRESVISTLDAALGSPEERLFGALASGARAMILNLCKDSEGRVDIEGNQESLNELQGQKIFLHRCYSPRRELEAIKDGLLRFFDENKDLHPHEALVLCADWEHYAPIIESVFSSTKDSKGYIPVTVAGGVAGDSPFFQSFRNVLSFRGNRFEAESVFALLEMPAIRGKYDLDEESVSVLADLVGKANIRWGFDDADVSAILEIEPKPGSYPFTWQRGFDRLTAELFYGFPEDEYLLLDVGGIGKLRPCGFVEGERVRLVSSLWHLVRDLKWLRDEFAADRKMAPDEIQQKLMEVIERFYDENDEKILNEVIRTRQAIRETAKAMQIAGIDLVYAEVFITSALSALSGIVPGMRPAGDSVLFAPLNCSNAVPHQLVWICGLNDGVFPKMEYRASYDLIGKHPSLFDVTSREKDAFALLKAVLCSRKQLCLSYHGMDNHTNEEIPPSVLLNDLTDFFTASKIPYIAFKHPMHAYSKRYFTQGKNADSETVLPPSYSAMNEEIAKNLGVSHEGREVIPFPMADDSVTEIQLDQLAEFFSGPNQYLFRRDNIYVSDSQYDHINSKECLLAKIDRTLQKALVVNGLCDERAAENQVEIGMAPDPDSAKAKIEAVGKIHDRPFSFYRKPAYTCKNVLLAEAFQEFQKAAAGSGTDAPVMLDIEKHSVLLHQQYATIKVDCVKGLQKFMMFYETYHNDKNARNRALIRYLGANAAEGEIAAVLFGPEETPKAILLPSLSVQEAKEKLIEIITLAGTPIPSDMPDYRNISFKKDNLPTEWQTKMDAIYAAVMEKKE